MSPSRRLALLAILSVAAVAACSIQDDPEPRAIDRSQVPFSLLATSTTTTEAVRPPIMEIPASIFLVDSDTEQLIEVMRMVAPPSSVRASIQELLEGPMGEELAMGLNSAIARSTVLLGVDGPRSGVVTIDLSDDLRSIGGQGQRLALAQMVFTATATPEVTGVLFAFEGEISEVPNGQGVSTTEPLNRADFATFDPSVPAPPPPEAPEAAPESSSPPPG